MVPLHFSTRWVPTFDAELYKPSGMSLEFKVTKSSFRFPQEHLKDPFTTNILFVSETNHWMCNTATSLSTNQQAILLICKGVQTAKHKASFPVQVMTAPSAQLLSGIKNPRPL